MKPLWSNLGRHCLDTDWEVMCTQHSSSAPVVLLQPNLHRVCMEHALDTAVSTVPPLLLCTKCMQVCGIQIVPVNTVRRLACPIALLVFTWRSSTGPLWFSEVFQDQSLTSCVKNSNGLGDSLQEASCLFSLDMWDLSPFLSVGNVLLTNEDLYAGTKLIFCSFHKAPVSQCQDVSKADLPAICTRNSYDSSLQRPQDHTHLYRKTATDGSGAACIR